MVTLRYDNVVIVNLRHGVNDATLRKFGGFGSWAVFFIIKQVELQS